MKKPTTQDLIDGMGMLGIIGITNYTVEERFRAPELARIRVVKTWRYAIGRAAAEREAEILKQYAGDRYYGPDILVGACAPKYSPTIY